MSEYLLVIDEGTTSTRAMLFRPTGECVGSEVAALTQGYPRPGWVEHDAAEIWRRSLRVAGAMVAQAGGPERIAAIGVTNQRETVVFWDRSTGEPLAPAIVWQDRRTADRCRALRDAGGAPAVQARTGLLLDPYFSVTDATNAGRTALMDLATGQWDIDLLDLFGASRAALPEIVDCAGRFGEARAFGPAIPICGLAGDQQAASIGQACLRPGETKATFGTGAFILTHTGRALASDHRLLSTVAWQLGGERAYALEGSVFIAGSLVQWLRDSLGLIGTAAETEALARSVPDNGGVYLVPALSGLGAPWWRPDARGSLSGLSFSATRAHVARAALEAQGYQAHDLQTAFAADGQDWAALRIDGGMVANDWMAQDLADMLALPVERPRFAETTALGAAMLAGIGVGLFASLDEAAGMRGAVERFEPMIGADEREARLAGWRHAVEGVLRA